MYAVLVWGGRALRRSAGSNEARTRTVLPASESVAQLAKTAVFEVFLQAVRRFLRNCRGFPTIRSARLPVRRRAQVYWVAMDEILQDILAYLRAHDELPEKELKSILHARDRLLPPDAPRYSKKARSARWQAGSSAR